MKRYFIKRPHNSSANMQNNEDNQNTQQSQMNQNTQQSQPNQHTQQSQSNQNTQQSQSNQNTQQSQSNQNTQQSQSNQNTQQSQMNQNTQQSQMNQNTQQSQMNQNTQQSQMNQNTQQSQMNQNTQQSQMNQNTQQSQMNQHTQQSQSNQHTQQSQSNQNTQQSQSNQHTQQSQPNQNTQQSQSNQHTQQSQSNQNTQQSQPNQNTQQSQMNQNTQQSQPNQNTQSKQKKTQTPISIALAINVANIEQTLGEPDDLIIRELTVGASESKGCIVHISGISDQEMINNNILKTVQSNMKQFKGNLLDKIYEEVIAITGTKKVTTFEGLLDAVLAGNAVFLLDGENTVLEMDTAGGEQRAINEPQTETVIRGPRTGFVENIATNISLLRRTIKDPNLRFKMHKVGNRSKQQIAVCYVEGIVNPDIVDEVERRIKTINIDYAPDSGFVEQWIEDSFLSPFPLLLDTERPDRVMYSILEGKIGILVEGSPSVLIAPVTFGNAIQAIEDFSQRWMVSSLVRILRYVALFIALFLPALYVALISYHPGMIPTKIAFSIAATREGVPFPSLVEALLMAVTFEILQEAGIRLPKAIGQTVGIVGGIVIGDVAVSAGLVSPAMVIVTSLTAIASFTLPNYSMAVGLRLMRFALIMAAAMFGLYGVILVFIMLCIHLANLKSMGVPYTAPFAPHFLGSLKNIFVRPPIMSLKKRQAYLRTEDEKKLNDGGQTK